MVLNCNTDLCVDVKTLLRSDRRTRLGKNYTGVLTRDAEEHYTFVERQPSTGRQAQSASQSVDAL